MKIEWFRYKFSSQTEMIGHLYNRHVDDDEEAAQKLDKYLQTNGDYKKFKNDIRKGDEIWLFVNKPASWNRNEGKEGYSILRNGIIINSFLSFGSL